ncbi:hypothetical protein DFP72DRAFT_1166096 [Ephemerocybe angulata]|uniref:Uncharacterized protein n=1 Tax=Ephemerocybe angulata TaxID=980116 RepID=A0A8H6MDW7_9AGAR|nr:hypothetical protein DFP72DRAFT_1166096 [Tulosesus angulatus]
MSDKLQQIVLEKRTVYLAFYRRNGDPGMYHVGILVTPKSPKIWPRNGPPPTEKDMDCTLFYPVAEILEYRPWQFEMKSTMARTELLAGLVYVGATVYYDELLQFSIEELVPRFFPLMNYSNSHNWRGKDWVINALNYLIWSVAIDVDPTYPIGYGTADHILKKGAAFLHKQPPSDSSDRWSKPVPTCNRSGEMIPSKVGPAPRMRVRKQRDDTHRVKWRTA